MNHISRKIFSYFTFHLPYGTFFFVVVVVGISQKTNFKKSHSTRGKKRNKIDAIFDEEKIIQSSRCPSLNKTQTRDRKKRTKIQNKFLINWLFILETGKKSSINRIFVHLVATDFSCFSFLFH